MLKDYPSTCLFLLSLVALIVITVSAPIIGPWNIYCSLITEVLKFTMRVVFGFFFFCMILETGHSFFFRHHHH